MEGIGIIGGGGHADEVAASVSDKVAFSAVTKEYNADGSKVDVDSPGEYAKCPVHVAIGAPYVRRMIVERWPGERYVTVSSPASHIDRSAKISDGCYIAPLSLISTNVKVGRHCIVNSGALVHHNCVLGDYVTVCPGVSIGGGVEVGNGVFVGIGAVVSNGLRIASGVVIGAGAVVVSDLEQENGVYVGAPAKLIKVNDGWLRKI